MSDNNPAVLFKSVAVAVFLVAAILLPLLSVHQETPPPTASPSSPTTEETPQPTEYSAIDEHALHPPPEARRTVETLARWLVEPAHGDREKARAIFRWITANVEYDVPAFRSGQTSRQSAEDVLASRKAVCQGYANLFKAMADAVGLQAVVVPGFSRGVTYTVGDSYAAAADNHAWNAVQIEGKWYLLDSTWGSGTVEPGSDRMTARFQPFFFLTPPEQLIYSHLPRDDKWQLLERPLSRAEHERLPQLKPEAFQYQVGVNRQAGCVLQTTSRGEISVTAPSQTRLTAFLYAVGTTRPLDGTYTLVQREAADTYTVHVVAPRADRYVLRIFAGDARAERLWDAVEYCLQASAGEETARYPKTSGMFMRSGARLYSPLQGALPANSTQRFQIEVPGASKVSLIEGSNWHPLEKAGDMFSGDVPVGMGRLTLATSSATDERQYLDLVEYTTQ